MSPLCRWQGLHTTHELVLGHYLLGSSTQGTSAATFWGGELRDDVGFQWTIAGDSGLQLATAGEDG
jgi:hypothetical protein